MPGSIQSIERAAAILRLLAARPVRLRLADIASSLQLAKGTAHGILRTLTEVQLVEQDRATGKYQLGALWWDLGAAHLDINELRARSLNWADPLAARTGETVRVCVLTGRDAVVVHHVFRPDDTPQKADVGALLPAHACAPGKRLLAHDPATPPHRTGAPTAFTARTVASYGQLVREFPDIRAQGYAVEIGEWVPGQASIAAPICGLGGVVVAAVSIHGDIDRLCDTTGKARPDLASQVRACARSISRELESARVNR